MINGLGHVTWSHDRTVYKYPVLSHKFQTFAPAHLLLLTRGVTLLLLSSNFSSFLSLLILLFSWSERIYSKTFSNCVLAEIQLHPIKILLTHFKIMSQPKFSVKIILAGLLVVASPRCQPTEILT